MIDQPPEGISARAGQHHPGLVIELEDGIHAHAKAVAQVDKLDAEGERQAGEDEQEGKQAAWQV